MIGIIAYTHTNPLIIEGPQTKYFTFLKNVKNTTRKLVWVVAKIVFTLTRPSRDYTIHINTRQICANNLSRNVSTVQKENFVHLCTILQSRGIQLINVIRFFFSKFASNNC